MYKLFVIGVAEPYFSQYQTECISDCSHIFATQRFHQILPPHNGQIHPISPLSQTFTKIKQLLPDGNIAILASGDPLFFGIGKTLLKHFSQEQLFFLPALSSVQRACALFQLPWDDANIVSLHGRNHQHLPTLLLQSPKTIVFTDVNNSPDKIAYDIRQYFQSLKEHEVTENIETYVAEDIGLDTQKIFHGSLEACSKTRFSSLNIMCILLPTKKQPRFSFGLEEKEIQHSRGLITKNEIRAATLHQLRLPKSGVFWDIGAGSGSVSIEAARSTPDLTVYAIDHKGEELENIKTNIRRYGCYNIVPIAGKAPDCLTTLPAPDRIFIGGSGGNLETIIGYCADHLKEDGKVVVNGVLPKTIETAPRLLAEHKFTTSTSTVNVSRTTSAGELLDFNPITIICGTR